MQRGCLILMHKILAERDFGFSGGMFFGVGASMTDLGDYPLTDQFTDGESDAVLVGEEPLRANGVSDFVGGHSGVTVEIFAEQFDGGDFLNGFEDDVLTIDGCLTGDLDFDQCCLFGECGDGGLNECPHWERVADILGRWHFKCLVIHLELRRLDLRNSEKMFFGLID